MFGGEGISLSFPAFPSRAGLQDPSINGLVGSSLSLKIDKLDDVFCTSLRMRYLAQWEMKGLGWDSLISYTKTSKPVIILMVTGILAGRASQDLCHSDRNRAPIHPRFLSLIW